jgi:nucleoside-diphosphate-sugar epimerase
MSKLLITGGTGFYGKNVLQYIFSSEMLCSVYSEILIVTRHQPHDFLDQFLAFKHPNITFYTSDVRTFEYANTDIEYIMHLATDASNVLNDNHPDEMMDVILNGTRNILSIAKRQKKIKSFLFASSGAVYGDVPNSIQNIDENDRFDLDFNNPKNAYAQAKRTAEMMCSIYREKYQIPVVIARGFAFYGDYLPTDRHFAIADFIKQVKENHKIVIKSDGKSKRSYMHSKELAKSLIELLNVKIDKEYIFNIGSDEGKSLLEWANEIARNNGNAEVVILNEPQKGYSAGNNYVPSIDRLKKIVILNQRKKIEL